MKVANEINAFEGLLLDLQFLQFHRAAKDTQLIDKWLSFLFGSLYHDMQLLHVQHSGQIPHTMINLNKGLPGRPDTAPKTLRKTIQIITNSNSDEEDLYS